MNQSPRLLIFDVGHGSCVFLHDGSITTVIDCKESALLIEFLLAEGITTITQVVISHADADHIDGILALIQSDYIKLETVFVNSDSRKDSDAWMDLRMALQDASQRGKVKVRTEIGSGMEDLLAHEKVKIEVVAPGVAFRLAGAGGQSPQGSCANSNAMSVVLRLHHDGHPVALIPGDLDIVGLSDLVSRNREIRCDILLFPHHGGHISHGGSVASKARKNADFARTIIEQVRPRLVLFSIGRGRFSTPRPEIVDQILTQGTGCHIHCTQLSEHCHPLPPDNDGGHLNALPAHGRIQNKCCGGSLEIVFSGAQTLAQMDCSEHTKFIDSMVSQPLCRSIRGTP